MLLSSLHTQGILGLRLSNLNTGSWGVNPCYLSPQWLPGQTLIPQPPVMAQLAPPPELQTRLNLKYERAQWG